MVPRIAIAGLFFGWLPAVSLAAGEADAPQSPESARGAQGHLKFYGRWLGAERSSEADLSKVSAAELLARGESRMKGGLFLEASGDFAVAIIKSAEDARAHVLFAHSLLGLSEFRLAGREIALALECDERLDPAKEDPSSLFPDKGFYSERVRALGRAFETKPGSPEALLLGFHRLAAGDADGAVRALGAVRREDREHAAAARLLVRIGDAERPREPMPIAPPVRKAEPPPPPPPDPFREAFDRGLSALKAGHWPDAQAALRSAVAEKSGDASALVALGLALAATGDVRPASAAIATGLARDPSLAESGRAAGRFGGAVLEKAAARLEGSDPTSASTAFLRGFLAASAGRDEDASKFLRSIPAGQYEFDGARRLLDAIAARVPATAPEARPATVPDPAKAPAAGTDAAGMKSGDEAFRAGRFEEAMEAYRRTAGGDPKAAEPFAALAEAAFASGNFPLAAEALLEAFGRDPAWFDGRFSPRLPLPGRGLEDERLKALRARAAPADLPLRILFAVRAIYAGDVDEATTALGGAPGDDPAHERARRFFLDQVEVLRARAPDLRSSF